MKVYIGVDVGKANLDVCGFGKHARYENDKAGINTLLKALKDNQTQGDLLVLACEATGGYEKALVDASVQAGIKSCVLHPNKVKAFAKSCGQLAKTDKIDAKQIQAYAQMMQVEPKTHQVTKEAEKIGVLLKRRKQLQAAKKKEQVRLDKRLDKDIQSSIESHVRWLEKAIKKIDQQLAAKSEDEQIKRQKDLYKSIPGVGDLCALSMIAFLPELGQVSSKELSALVGVAPYNRESGQYRGKRYIQGGRSLLRSVLYMCAVASLHCNKDLKSFYDRLCLAGKPKKVALVAVMRKLVCLLNSISHRQTPWEEKKLNLA